VTRQAGWEEAKAVIEEFTGPVRDVRFASAGFNADIAAIVNHRYFVKGLRREHPQAWTQLREKDINPYVRHVSAPVEWHADKNGWIILGFTCLPGRHADYRPGSPDLPLIAQVIGRIPPAPAGLDLKRAELRWSAYSPQPDLFAGDHLSHTDWSPGNVLIDDGARLVDWAWPTRGAAWIDPACWVVWLIASGHNPAQAQAQAARIPAFARAPEQAVTAFAAAQAAIVGRHRRTRAPRPPGGGSSRLAQAPDKVLKGTARNVPASPVNQAHAP